MYHFGLLVLRVGFSGLLLTHGIPKINMLLENPSGFPNPFGVGATASLLFAILAEVIAPLFIIAGFKTRWATIPVIITMGIAAFVIHQADNFATREKAILYLVGFLVIAFTGPGKYSVDGRN